MNKSKGKVSSISKRRTHEEFVDLVHKKHPNIKILSKYIASTKKVDCVCLIDGHRWSALANNLVMGSGCKKCAGTIRKTPEEFVNDLHAVNPNITPIGTYTTCMKKIKFRCNVCGLEFDKIPNDILRGSGCPKCGHNRGGRVRRKSHEQFLKDLSIVNPDVEVLGKYVKNNQKLSVRCLKCGNKYDITPNGLLVGHRCAVCSSNSRGEDRVRQYLQQRGIVFKEQYKFDGCKNKRLLRFDFYLPEQNVCIEYDGKQHFLDKSFTDHSDPLSLIQKRDKIKDDYCRENKIRLIRIPYTEFNNIERILEAV